MEFSSWFDYLVNQLLNYKFRSERIFFALFLFVKSFNKANWLLGKEEFSVVVDEEDVGVVGAWWLFDVEVCLLVLE